jgi:hypothetical protein
MLVHQVGMEPTGPLRLILLVTSIALLLLAPTRRLFSRTWQRLERKRRGRWLLASVVAGGLLALAIPVEHTPLRSVEETVEVVATGDRNPASAGSEVWIFKVTENDRPLDLTDFDLPPSWELREGALLSAGQSMPAPISWPTEVSRQTDLVMLTHPFSGIVEVTRAGATERIDLYNPTGIAQVIELAPSSRPWLYHLSVLLASSLSLGLMFFAGSVWLILRPLRAPELPAGHEPSAAAPHERLGKWEWVAFATPPAVVWAAYLLAFWPGVMSFDSIDQWTQFRTGNYNDWHPVFHTLTEWTLTRLVESPAIVAAAQVAVLSSVVGWALASMRRLGLPAKAAWAVSGVAAVWPANGITVITLWKDIPYAIGVLALGVIMLREIDGRNSLIDKRRGWILVAGVASLVSLYHHAGILVAVGSLGVLWLAVRKRAILGATLLLVIVVGIVEGGLYRAVGVSGPDHPGITGIVIHHIGSHLAGGTEITADERSEIAVLIPIPGTAWYDCEQINSIIFNPNFSISDMHENAGRARALWWSLFTRNPGVDLGHLSCSSHVVWHIRQVPGGHHYVSQLAQGPDGAVSTIIPNELGFELNPVADALTRPLASVVVKTQRPLISWLFWRGPLFLYVLLTGAAVAALRAKNWRYWAVASPGFLVAVSLVIAAPAQGYRYMYPVVLSGMVLGPYLLLAVVRSDPSGRQPAVGPASETLTNQ